MRGGTGNDYLDLFRNSTVSQNVVMEGGIGNDTASVNIGGNIIASVDLGEGNDFVSGYAYSGASTRLTLGLGRDTIELSYLYDEFALTITDFQVGPQGDIFKLSTIRNGSLIGWDGSVNPFGTSGYLRLIQSGADTLFQVDRDGTGNESQFYTFATLQNVTASQLETANFIEFNPDGSAASGQIINGTSGNFS